MAVDEHESEDPGGHRAGEPAKERLRALVCDDDPMARRVIRDALQDAGITVVAEAASRRDALELTLHYRPDVVLIDVAKDDPDALQLIRRIAEQAPEVQLTVLSPTEDPELGLTCLRAGASGYLSKAIDLTVLAQEVRRVARGEASVSPGLTLYLIQRVRAMPNDGIGVRPVRSPLTSREWEVLDLLCAGKRVDEIAREFVLSVDTVRSHVKNIMRKLQVHSQQDAIRAARHMRIPLAGAVRSSWAVRSSGGDPPAA